MKTYLVTQYSLLSPDDKAFLPKTDTTNHVTRLVNSDWPSMPAVSTGLKIYVQFILPTLRICFTETNSSLLLAAQGSNHPRIIQATTLTQTHASLSSIRFVHHIMHYKNSGTKRSQFQHSRNSEYAYTTKYWHKTYLPPQTPHLCDPCTTTSIK
jgi:hypothetical protein